MRRAKPSADYSPLRRALTLAVAIYLAIVQILTVVHAASGEGTTPDHDKAACVLHIAGDRAHAPMPATEAIIKEPAAQFVAFVVRTTSSPLGACPGLPPARGPPVL